MKLGSLDNISIPCDYSQYPSLGTIHDAGSIREAGIGIESTDRHFLSASKNGM